MVVVQLEEKGNWRATDQQLQDRLTRWTSAGRGLTQVCTWRCGVVWMKRYRLGSVQPQRTKTYSTH